MCRFDFKSPNNADSTTGEGALIHCGPIYHLLHVRSHCYALHVEYDACQSIFQFSCQFWGSRTIKEESSGNYAWIANKIRSKLTTAVCGHSTFPALFHVGCENADKSTMKCMSQSRSSVAIWEPVFFFVAPVVDDDDLDEDEGRAIIAPDDSSPSSSSSFSTLK